MIKIVRPKPFFYKGGDKSILLLHSFTSNTIDMKKLGINGVLTMSVPTHREAAFLHKRVFHYAKGYKQLEGKNEEQINLELNRLNNMSIDSLVEFQQLIDTTMDKLAW